MQKDFDAWNEQKKKINLIERPGFYFREGDIWWASVGLNVGHEEDGKGADSRRPVLVVKKFNNELAHVVPLTTQFKENPYYIPLTMRVSYANYSLLRSIMTSQSKSLSPKRFWSKAGWISKEELESIKKVLRAVL